MTLNDRDRDIAGARRSHVRLVEHLRTATFDPQRPSLLNGWSIANLATHIARNAESHTGMLRAAAEGRVPVQYPGGLEQRNGDITAGATRTGEELVEHVQRAVNDLEAAWDAATDDHWAQVGLRLPEHEERLVLADLPFLRWREVEIHHSDLGIKGFTFEAWDPEYVRLELRRQEMTWASRKPMGLTALPPEAMNLSPVTRLAWLTGRITPAGLEPVQFP